MFIRSIRPLGLMLAAFIVGEISFAGDDLSNPKPHLGHSDSAGRILVWRHVDAALIDENTALPVVLCFSSAPTPSRSLFGRNWYCPLLDTSLVAYSENVMKWMTLGGRTVYLKANKEGKFLSGDGRVVGKSISSSEWSIKSGDWEYIYAFGKLRSIKLENGDELRWEYRGSSLLGISHSRLGTLISVENSGSDAFPSEIVVGKSRHKLSYQSVPVMADVKGRPVLTGYEKSLAGIEGPNAYQKFPVTLTESGEYVMKFDSNFWEPAEFVWAATSGAIKSDGEYVYSVSLKPKRPPVVSRTDKDGGVESYSYDSQTGTSEQLLPDGTMIARSYFVAPGPAQNKIRKATSTKGGKELFNRQWSYDEAGRLIRDRQGPFERTWTWSEAGSLLGERQTINEKTIWQTTYDEKGRIFERFVNNKTYRYAYDGGKTILQRLENGKVISSRVREIESGKTVFFTMDKQAGDLASSVPAFGAAVSAEEVEKAKEAAMKALGTAAEKN